MQCIYVYICCWSFVTRERKKETYSEIRTVYIYTEKDGEKRESIDDECACDGWYRFFQKISQLAVIRIVLHEG